VEVQRASRWICGVGVVVQPKQAQQLSKQVHKKKKLSTQWRCREQVDGFVELVWSWCGRPAETGAATEQAGA